MARGKCSHHCATLAPRFQILLSSAYSFAVLCSPLWLMFALYVFWGRRSIIDPIYAAIFVYGSVHVFEVGFAGQSFIFSLHDINLTLGLLPSRRQVIWRDSVGVGSSGLGLKSERVWIFFNRAFSGCYTILIWATITAKQLSLATILLCFEFFCCHVDVLQS